MKPRPARNHAPKYATLPSHEDPEESAASPFIPYHRPARLRLRLSVRLSWNEMRVRAAHPEAALADLYDPDLMPPDLRRAHQSLDRAVDRLYRRTGFSSERERVEHLFALYEKMHAPLEAWVRKKPRRRRR